MAFNIRPLTTIHVILLTLLPLSATVPPASSADLLILQAPHRDRSDALKFGRTACVDPSGRHVLVGANGHSKFKGAMYLYSLSNSEGHRVENWRRRMLTAADTQSAEERSAQLRPQRRGSGFGFSCAFQRTLSPDPLPVIAVGAPGHDVQRGAVYLFKSAGDHSDEDLYPATKLESTDRRTGDLFGWAVAMDGSGRTVAVSARGRRANNGQVDIFDCDEEHRNCSMTGTLTPPDYTDSAGPRGIRIRNNFGISIALSGDGKTLVVGSPGYEEERGVAYVFVRGDGDGWTMVERLKAQLAKKFSYFGFKVAMDSSAKVIVVGADGEDEYAGAAYVFEADVEKKQGEENIRRYKMTKELRATSRSSEDNFGGSVSVSGNGRVIGVGAPGRHHAEMKDHGVLYLYERVGEGEKDWEMTEHVRLPREYWESKTFFAWDVGLSEEGRRYVATAPKEGDKDGLAAVGMFEASGRREADGKWLSQDDVVKEEKEDL